MQMLLLGSVFVGATRSLTRLISLWKTVVKKARVTLLSSEMVTTPHVTEKANKRGESVVTTNKINNLDTEQVVISILRKRN